jgi:hypothetical protein
VGLVVGKKGSCCLTHVKKSADANAFICLLLYQKQNIFIVTKICKSIFFRYLLVFNLNGCLLEVKAANKDSLDKMASKKHVFQLFHYCKITKN